MKKTWLSRAKAAYARLPMQRKMLYAYAVPVIAVCVLANLLALPLITASYAHQLKHGIEQASDQADNFVADYTDTMYYISQLITQNGNIRAALSMPEFGSHTAPDEAYREYFLLNSEFESISFSNSTYNIGLFVPDALLYSNNNHYFYPQSTLESRSDYANLRNALQRGRPYFALAQEKRSSNPSLTDDYLALFQAMTVEQNGQEVTYVVKVELLMQNVRELLYHANSTENGLVYLTDASGRFLGSTDDARYTALGKTGPLPVARADDWTRVKLGGVQYYLVWRQIGKYNWQLFSLIPQREFSRQMSFLWILTIAVILSLSVTVAYVSYRLSRYYVGRLSGLGLKMKQLESGDLGEGLLLREKKRSSDEIDAIYNDFNYMVGELRRLMDERFRLGREAAAAELKALQAQINPHFLYNTLDLINWGAMDYGADQVAEIARNLGQFYRLSLNHGRMSIRIGDELRHVEAYVKIENVHFGGAVNLELDVPEEIRQLGCLNIILQPFVENAIVHGIAEHSDIVECNIAIAARQQGNDLLFAITDDGPGMDGRQLANILETSSSSTYNGYGVKNIHSRLKLCYGPGYGVSYQSQEGLGTTVTLKIPALTVEQLDDLLK